MSRIKKTYEQLLTERDKLRDKLHHLNMAIKAREERMLAKAKRPGLDKYQLITPVERIIGLNTAAANKLKAAGYKTIYDLVELKATNSEHQLNSIRLFGDKAKQALDAMYNTTEVQTYLQGMKHN